MKQKPYDITALGELLIDMTQNGVSAQGNPLFEANPGGAPANVLAMARKLGHSCAFIGKVGKDSFGDLLEETLEQAGIDTEGLARDPQIPTTLALVHTLPDGERDFTFYRKPGADLLLQIDEVPDDLLEDCRIFHYGTLSLSEEPCRSATQFAVETAREAGALLSFDPNLRMPLWSDEEAARTQIAWGLARCDILKIADNEAEFMTGTADLEQAARILQSQYPGIRLLNITSGARGSDSWYRGIHVHEPACSRGGVIETTGAGDTFCACVLHYVLEHGLSDLQEADLREMLHYANTAAYLVTTRRGAIPAMPDPAEVEALL